MSYPPAAAPVVGRERISSIDVLRGVALLGILLMNIVAMGLPHWAYDDPVIIGNRSPADYWTWAVNAVLFEGKMRTIFSMLFGAGIILITTRAEEKAGRDAPADIHLRRNMWLVLFGMIHGYLLLWPGDILYMYGLAGMFLFVFRRVRPRNLVILGAIILALQIPKMYGMSRGVSEAREGLARIQTQTAAGGQPVTEDQQKQQEWQETMAEVRPAQDKIQKEIDDRSAGYGRNLATLAPIVFMLETKMAYAVGIWDVAGMMLLGMALMKLGVFSAAKSYRYYAVMALAGYAYGISAGTFVVWDWTRNGFTPGTRWLTLYDTTRLAVAMGHIAVVMMICKAGVLRVLTRPLAAVGQMALTNYIMHSGIVMFVFTGLGFSLFGQLSRHQLYYVVGAIWVVQLIASPLWLRYFQFGPLEWLWRSLTYNKKQPMRIRAHVAQPEPATAAV